MIYNRKGTHLTVLLEKELLSANTMQEETRLFGTLPFLLYTVRQVALFVFRILLLHSDRLSGHRFRIFHRVPAFLPVFLRFSDVSGHQITEITLKLKYVVIMWFIECHLERNNLCLLISVVMVNMCLITVSKQIKAG